MKLLFARLWESPTVTSWTSVAVRGLSVLVVLPLLLTRLEAQEIAVWYLLTTVIGLQGLADIGFAPSFARAIGYAMGGAQDVSSISGPSLVANGAPNWPLVGRVWHTMHRVYAWIAAGSVVLMVTVGTLAVRKPISALPNSSEGWMAWGIVVVVSGLSLGGNVYSAYLQGVNEIPLLRRWETLTVFGSIVTSFLVLFAGGGLLSLVIANQSWAAVGLVRNRFLARSVQGGRARYFKTKGSDREMLQQIWPSAWRSGLGGAFSRGIAMSSGFVYAQISSGQQLATYLLGLRLIQLIGEFAQAPFYSKLPVLAQLRARGDNSTLLKIARRGMHLSYWAYATLFVAVATLGPFALTMIGSNAEFPEARLWAVLGLAFFFERYGAMHLQLYTTTNHVIWHVANGVAGIVFLLVGLLLLRRAGLYAFPLAFLAGNVGFYAWYPAVHSYREFQLRPMFDVATFGPPLVTMLGYAVAAFAGRLG